MNFFQSKPLSGFGNVSLVGRVISPHRGPLPQGEGDAHSRFLNRQNGAVVQETGFRFSLPMNLVAADVRRLHLKASAGI